MTADAVTTADTAQDKQSTTEQNFAMLRKKTQQAETMIAQERSERVRLQEENLALKDQINRSSPKPNDDDEDWGDEPYLEQKKFKRIMQRERAAIIEEAEARARRVIEEENSRNYMSRLKSDYSDFNEVCTDESLNRLEAANPDIAKEILSLKDPYQQRKMAYLTIKTAGFHKKPEPENPSIQSQIDNNPRKLYYTPNTASTSATAMTGDFSESGKKQAYEKIKELAKRAGRGIQR